MKIIIIILFLLISNNSFSQGINSHWLVGYYSIGNDPNMKARLVFNSNSYLLLPDDRNMGFKDTQGNISDQNGNLLMSSNGVWIMNATGDTMENGSDINPGSFVNSWGGGLPLVYANLFLPMPGDTTKYVLFHHSANYNGSYHPANELFYTIIDITQDSGLGSVLSKNNIALIDTLNWGIAACKHANGRDWWVVMQKDSSDIIFKILFTNNGIESISSQSLGFSPLPWGHLCQLTFSQNGDKFIMTTYNPVPGDLKNYLLVTDFDRCTGLFYNSQTIQITDNDYLWGLSFSPSGEYIYTCTSSILYQINGFNLTVDTIAVNDGFASPFPPFFTTFDLMYLAANGKIYLTSGNSTSHFHFINYPDSAGSACGVQQHALYIDSVRHFRGVPNHPNYYLGPVAGSICDSLTSVIDIEHDFKFSVFPNPSNGEFRIMYLLPQNKKGLVEVFDIKGRIVYSYNLPQWSTLQQFNLNHLSQGIYAVKISSEGHSTVKKIIISR